MFETSLNMALPATLASLPRVFLTPVIPGFEGTNGNVNLPLLMDGGGVDIGVHIHDDKGLSEWVNAHQSFFASKHNDFEIYPTRCAYEDVVQPPWLKNAGKRIDDTIANYAKGLGAGSKLRSVVTRLQNRWSGMQPLLSAVLYIKLPVQPLTRAMMPQDLSLYGPPLEKGDLRGTIDFLETLTHIDDLILEGMVDRIVVEDEEEQTVRELHDVFEKPADPWLQVYDAFGKPVRFEKSQVRVTCTYVLNDERKINPLSSGAAIVHGAYDAFQEEMLQRNIMMTGAYLMAHFRFDDQEAGDLIRRIAPHVSQSPDLLTDDERSIVTSHLRSTGRGQGLNTEGYALLISKVLRKIVRTA